MSQAARTSNKAVWILLGVALILAAGIFAAVQAGLFASKPGQWSFTSLKPGEEPPGKNEPTLYTGDRLLAWSEYSSRRYGYVLIQDRARLETEASEVVEGEMNGKPAWAGGVELGKGKGAVRLVVIDSSRELEDLTTLLKELNRERAEPDRRVDLLRLRLREEYKEQGLEVFSSPWYTLEGERPGSATAGGTEGSGGEAGAATTPGENAPEGTPGPAATGLESPDIPK